MSDSNIIDLEANATNGHIAPRAFHYKVTDIGSVTVVATSSTTARIGLQQQFPDKDVEMLGCSDILMQVNDNSILDV